MLRVMLRCFVGLRVSEASLAALEALQAQVQRLPTSAAEKIRYTRRDNFHATAQFLGATPADKVPEIIAALTDVARTTRPVAHVRLSGLGAFPSDERPRAVFAAVGTGREWVVDLSARVANALGITEGRERVPHVTLLRVDRARRSGPLTQWLRTCDAPHIGELRTDFLVLLESKPGPTGSHYTTLAEVALP
jgi:RNA 2',3'-cyclic 3'-phosphodiesterase